MLINSRTIQSNWGPVNVDMQISPVNIYVDFTPEYWPFVRDQMVVAGNIETYYEQINELFAKFNFEYADLRSRFTLYDLEQDENIYYCTMYDEKDWYNIILITLTDKVLCYMRQTNKANYYLGYSLKEMLKLEPLAESAGVGDWPPESEIGQYKVMGDCCILSDGNCILRLPDEQYVHVTDSGYNIHNAENLIKSINGEYVDLFIEEDEIEIDKEPLANSFYGWTIIKTEIISAYSSLLTITKNDDIFNVLYNNLHGNITGEVFTDSKTWPYESEQELEKVLNSLC